MIKKLLYLLPIILLAACAGNVETKTTPAPLYPEPITVELNTEDGYTLNVITRDTLLPIIIGNGDTLVTGTPVPATGKIIHPDSVAQPLVVTLNKPNPVINAHPNVHQIPENLTTITVDEHTLTTVFLQGFGKNDTAHFLLNSTGDRLETGVPIPAQGKIVHTTQPVPIQAQSPRFKDAAISNLQYLDVDQGMISSYVHAMLVDKNGNLWFGTYGGGLSRYDGEFFTHFTENEGLSHNIIRFLMEDQYGNIWIGTEGGGVSCYNGDSFTHFTEKEGLGNNTVFSICETKNGNIWMGTNGSGVSCYDPVLEIFTHFTEKDGLIDNTVQAILEDESGNIWFGTEGGLSRYNPLSGGFTQFTEETGLSDNNVFSIITDKHGNMWFGTKNGVNRYDGKSFTHFNKEEGLSHNSVKSCFEATNGDLWFATSGGGVNRFDGEVFTHFTTEEGLCNDVAMCVIEDNSGNIWFGTRGGGVSRYNGESFAHFTDKVGLSDNNVWSILEDKKGDLWFGTYGGGVSHYNGIAFTHYVSENNRRNNIVFSSLADKNGKLWFGTHGGGMRSYDPLSKTFTYFTMAQGLSSNIVLSMIEDKNGNLWFGTNEGGVSCYDGEVFTHFTETEGLSNNTVLSICEDRNGKIWFGTKGGGVSHYDPISSQFTHYTTAEGLSNNTIYSIFEDRNGNLWFATDGGGACRYDPIKKWFTHYTMTEGLSHNIVYSTVEDKNGNFWLSTEFGLINLVLNSEFDSQAENEREIPTFKMVCFEKNDGLKGVDFYANSAYLDTKNRIWWGSGKSLTMLDMNKFSVSQETPSIQLRQLDINGQFVDYRNITDSLSNEIEFTGTQQFENYPLNLKLTHDKNHLTFRFSAIDWSAPHKVQYSYLMEGLNDNWSIPNPESKADYRNLPHGAYTFKVRAIGESGEWSEAFEYPFMIQPPWWHTWWARIGYGLSALLLIFGLVRWRTAKLKERQKELESEVEIATKDLVVKNQEISKQKEIVERAHVETEKQKQQVEEAHKEITDSINYAERIQRSFLASKELLDENLTEHFVFFQPKSVVSGDFYWAGKLANGNFAILNADSTGHGVPGAIMSILNISSIEKAIEQNLTNPADIFNATRKTIIERLKKDGSPDGGKDGMDASIICFDFEKNKFSYTTAQNPIWVIRAGELIIIKPEKMPIGKHNKDNIPFVGGDFEMQKGDLIYTLTDGFQDQFGGPKGKKFKPNQMRDYILSISHLPLKEQEQQLKEIFTNWKGDMEQVDDVCVIGIRI